MSDKKIEDKLLHKLTFFLKWIYKRYLYEVANIKLEFYSMKVNSIIIILKLFKKTKLNKLLIKLLLFG